MKDMLDKILEIEKKYIELGTTLSDPDVIHDYEKFRDLSKQRKAMEETVEVYREWKKNEEAISDAKELIKSESDEEMKEFLKTEMAENEKRNQELEERMKVLLLPRDPMDDKDIMLEIRGGAGGDEANIFAGEILISALLGILAFGLPVPAMFFEIFVAFIQAFVFMMLSIAYISTSVSEEH